MKVFLKYQSQVKAKTPFLSLDSHLLRVAKSRPAAVVPAIAAAGGWRTGILKNNRKITGKSPENPWDSKQGQRKMDKIPFWKIIHKESSEIVEEDHGTFGDDLKIVAH